MDGSFLIRAIANTIAVGLMLALPAVRPAMADPAARATAAYTRGDFDAALALWRPLAAKGEAGAQYGLATLYAKGQGVGQSAAEAFKWYRKAADQGHARAQFSLGLIHEQARGVPRDLAAAAKWYRLAAKQGVARRTRSGRRSATLGIVMPARECPTNTTSWRSAERMSSTTAST